MIWFGLYAATASVVAATLFVLAEFRRAPGTPAPKYPGCCALVAGLLWPLLLIGAAQCCLLFGVGRRLSRSAGWPRRVAQNVG